MKLYQPESGYAYNSDSLFLYNFIDSFQPKGRVLDVGAGCGIVGLLVAKENHNIELEAVEKQEHFIPYALKNAKVNGIEYTLHQRDFLEFQSQNKYDYIISNPPFYPDGVRKSQDEVLRHARYNSSLPMGEFFKQVSRLLKPHSHFIFCYDAIQFGLICSELEKVKMRVVDVQFVHPTATKAASLVLVHARNGSKSLMKVWPPFFSSHNGSHTPEAQEIFTKADTESIKCQL